MKCFMFCHHQGNSKEIPGTYADVVIKENEGIVVKRFPKTTTGVYFFEKELEALHLIRSTPALEKYVPWFIESANEIILEYCGKDLIEYLHTHGGRAPSCAFVMHFMRTFVPFINELHLMNVFHGDIKPSNITFNGTQFKLIDFNLTRIMKGYQSSRKMFYGTIPYISPVLLELPHDDQRVLLRWQDQYAFAMTALALFGFELDHDTLPIDKLREIFETGKILTKSSPNDAMYVFNQIRMIQMEEIVNKNTNISISMNEMNRENLEISNVIRILAGLVLSQLPQDRDYLFFIKERICYGKRNEHTELEFKRKKSIRECKRESEGVHASGSESEGVHASESGVKDSDDYWKLLYRIVMRTYVTTT